MSQPKIMTKIVLSFLLLSISLAAQTLPLNKTWELFYAYSNSTIKIAFAPNSFTYNLPLSSATSSPSKPYLVGEWAGYLMYIPPAGKHSIAAIDLTGRITMAGFITASPTVAFNYKSEPFNTCVSPATLRPFFAGVGSTGISNDRWWSAYA